MTGHRRETQREEDSSSAGLRTLQKNGDRRDGNADGVTDARVSEFARQPENLGRQTALSSNIGASTPANTVAPGADALVLWAGWPSSSLTCQHGILDRADLGVLVELVDNDLLYKFRNGGNSASMGLRGSNPTPSRREAEGLALAPESGGLPGNVPPPIVSRRTRQSRSDHQRGAPRNGTSAPYVAHARSTRATAAREGA